jgi:hypothetical protein
MRTRAIFAAAVVAAACLVAVEAPADPVTASESPTSAAMGTERTAPRESVVAGTIARSDRRGTELTMGDGTQLTVPLTVKGVVHTDPKPRRPIEAFRP